jgi:hypothetical protein
MVLKACLFVAAMTVVGCGSGKTETVPTSRPSGLGPQCSFPVDCGSCVEQNCNREAITAFGNGYMNNDFGGGQCPNLMTCSCTASASASGGMDLCTQQDGSNCVAAFTALTNCLDAVQCGTSCTGNNSNGGTGGIGGSGGTTGAGGITPTGGTGGIVSTGGIAGSGGAISTGGATGQQCLPSSDCLACVTQNCDSQATVAFGAGYTSGILGGGGQCPTFMVCSECTKSDHNAACAQQDGVGCPPALDAFNACFNSSCCTVCTGKTSCTDNSSGGGSCAAISMGNTSGSWTLQIIAQAGTDDFSSCSSPGQTLTVAVSGGNFSGPTSAVTCGGATSSTFSGTISSSGTMTGVFSGSVPDVCNIDACCSSPTSCATASNTPGACPGVILTKQ